MTEPGDPAAALIETMIERCDDILNRRAPWENVDAFCGGTVEDAVMLVWEGWHIVSSRCYTVPDQGFGTGRYQTLVLRHGHVWACLDVLVEFVVEPARPHVQWETHSLDARVYKVGQTAIDRGCPTGTGPLELAQNVGTELDHRVLSAASGWLTYARMGDVLLRMDPTAVSDDPDGAVSEEIKAMHALAGLGGLDGLRQWVDLAPLADVPGAGATSPRA